MGWSLPLLLLVVLLLAVERWFVAASLSVAILSHLHHLPDVVGVGVLKRAHGFYFTLGCASSVVVFVLPFVRARRLAKDLR